MNLFNQHKYSYILICISTIYTVGVLGITNNTPIPKSQFILLTPLNLILTCIFCFYFQEKWTKQSILVFIFIFLFGYFIEVIGVATGKIFGTYYYGKTLGFKLLDVPLLIGLLWLLLIYTIACTLNTIKSNLLFAILGASIMTILDVLIEPIAIQLDFWNWNNNSIPVQNYVAWFVISFLLLNIIRLKGVYTNNKIGFPILVIQFVFFITLNILL